MTSSSLFNHTGFAYRNADVRDEQTNAHARHARDAARANWRRPRLSLRLPGRPALRAA
jgi:hypothetical protein